MIPHYFSCSIYRLVQGWQDIVFNIKMRLPIGGAVVGVGTTMDTSIE